MRVKHVVQRVTSTDSRPALRAATCRRRQTSHSAIAPCQACQHTAALTSRLLRRLWRYPDPRAGQRSCLLSSFDHTKSSPGPLIPNSTNLTCSIPSSPKRGSFNVISEVKFSDGISWPVRIPCLPWNVERERTMQLDMAGLQYVMEHTSLPVPPIHAYECTTCHRHHFWRHPRRCRAQLAHRLYSVHSHLFPPADAGDSLASRDICLWHG